MYFDLKQSIFIKNCDIKKGDLPRRKHVLRRWPFLPFRPARHLPAGPVYRQRRPPDSADDPAVSRCFFLFPSWHPR